MRLKLVSIPLLLAVLTASFVAFASAPSLAQSARQGAPQNGLCTDEYLPVCALTKNGPLQTFSNACYAKRAGAAVVYPGACPFFCPWSYAPVCGRIGGAKPTNKTYPNWCFAKLDGAVVLAQGPCPGSICTQDYRPVCAVGSTGNRKTYSNRCAAINAGGRIIHDGPC